MDDRDLEARIGAHLHARLDGASPSPELSAAVDQILATRPRPVGLAALRPRAFAPGWLVVAAVVVLAVVAVSSFQLRILGPGASATPSPTEAPTTRQFIVLPSSLTAPDKEQTSLASGVLAERLKALGFGTFTSSAGIEIKFELPRTGPSDRVIEDALRATGDVAFVPLPRETYGDQSGGSGLNLPIGQGLPTEEPALFGWDGVESIIAGEGRTEPIPILTFQLTPAAAQAWADYTTAHQGELFALLIDGEVAAVPSINEPMTDGSFSLTGGGQPEDQWAVTRAVLAGGKLPEAWSPAVVPHVRPAGEFIPQMLFEYPEARFVSAELGVYQSNIGFPWVAVWRMTFEGDFPQCEAMNDLPPPACDGNRLLKVTVDVENGVGYP